MRLNITIVIDTGGMRGQPSLNGNITSARFYLLDRYLLEFHLLLIVATLFLLNGPFIVCMCMSTTVNVNDTVQFTFFLVMRLNITIVIDTGGMGAFFKAHLLKKVHFVCLHSLNRCHFNHF